MAAPSGFRSIWKTYTVELGAAPKHTGSRYMYGPFVVASRTDIKSADFLSDGGSVILGVGWKDAVSSADVNLPDHFYWGVLTKVGTRYVLQYVTKDGSANAVNRPDALAALIENPSTNSNPAYPAINFGAVIDPDPGVHNGAAAAAAPVAVDLTTGAAPNAVFTNKFNFIDLDAGDTGGPNIQTGANAITTHSSQLRIANYGGRLDGYEFLLTDAGKDIYSLRRIYTLAGTGDNPDYYRVRSNEGTTNYPADGSGDGVAERRAERLKNIRDDELTTFARGGGYVYTGDRNFSNASDVPSADTNRADLPFDKSLYLEETLYGDDAKVYRTHSDRVPLSVLYGGGEITLNVKYWQGPTPVDGERYPYEIRQVRLAVTDGVKGTSNYAFWAV